MNEVLVSKRPNGRFAAFSAACGYTRAERAFLRSYAFSPRNPLYANGPMRFVTVNGQKGVRARILTGVDRVYEAQTGYRRGYFALFDSAGDEEALRAALEEACRLQREWENVEMIGPLSPDGSGFFCGVGMASADEVPFRQDARGVLTGACNPVAERVLLRMGARAEAVNAAYSIRVPEENALREPAARAASRFGLRVETLRAAPFCEAWMQRILELSGSREKNEAAKLLACLRPLVDGRHSFAVCAGEEVRGYLLALRERGGCLRFTTLLTKPGTVSAPVAAVLLSAAVDSCIESGEKWVEASVIREDNLRSRALAERFKARAVRRYTQYIINVAIN